MATQRADARRNYAWILSVAEGEVAAHGADASLEQIARTAGVGSATVRRHFPGKRALLEAVFQGRADALCARAAELSTSADARAALLDWLGDFVDYAASARGMADALVQYGINDPGQVDGCARKLADAVDPLLKRADQARAVTSGVTAADLVTLVTGIALATEHLPNPAAEAHRLLGLTVSGICQIP
ncbi:TetR/AcrR family transcriptional regulator [Rhodococcus sp. UFZ-B548]|uniref:TetR/AcrR family transcriptional regulator n=1 Tax=Rhodococcus sp. UFZ-B548 TaxID=2742212 RepID=UPI0015F3CC5C|nr:TetR/AcrR family transcriptional regulator [Rhodococcus sp. UFZ-B548]